MRHLKLFTSDRDREKIKSVVSDYIFYLEDDGFKFDEIGSAEHLVGSKIHSDFVLEIYHGQKYGNSRNRNNDVIYHERKKKVQKFIVSDDFLEFIDRISADLSEFNIKYGLRISMGPAQFCYILVQFTKII